MPQQLGQLIFPVMLIAAFWFLLIRPQQKRAKEQAEMLSQLNIGTEIVTIGGIYGTIVETSDERLRIRVADGSEFEIARRAVGSVVQDRGTGESVPDDDDAGAEGTPAEQGAISDGDDSR